MSERLPLSKLAQRDQLAQLSSGRPGVPATLQLQQRQSSSTMDARRNTLREQFAKAAPAVERLGGEVNLNSLSITGQTVEAILPVDQYDQIETSLRSQEIRVDLLINRQVISD